MTAESENNRDKSEAHVELLDDQELDRVAGGIQITKRADSASAGLYRASIGL